MSERILVTGKKISSMELVTNVTGNEKIPTGQQDDLAITPNQLADYTIARGDLMSQEDLSHVEFSLGTQIAAEEEARIAADNLKVDKEGSVSSVAGRVGDVVLAPSDVLVEGFGSQEDVNKYVPKPFLSGYTYGLGERVVLNGGEVVKNLVDENVGNPNVDMTGWVSTVSDSLSDTVRTFNTPEAGVDSVTGVADGTYFNARSSNEDSYVDEYQNVGGSAVATGKSYPSGAALNNIPHNNLKDRGVTGAHPASAITDASGLNQQKINDGLDSIAELLSIPNPFNGMRVYVRSYHAEHPNSGGGEFVWDALSTELDDGGTVLSVDGISTGRFKRIFEGPLYLTWFGAVGDGVTNSTIYVQNAINCAQATNSKLYVPKGVYRIEPISVTRDNGKAALVIHGDCDRGNITTFSAMGEQDVLFMLSGRAHRFVDLNMSGSVNGDRVTGCAIYSEFSPSTTLINVSASGFNKYGLLYLDNSWSSRIEGCTTAYNDGFGLVLAGLCHNINMRKCYFGSNNGFGLFLHNSSGISINSCAFEVNLDGALYLNRGYNTSLRGCYFEGNGTRAITLTDQGGNRPVTVNTNIVVTSGWGLPDLEALSKNQRGMYYYTDSSKTSATSIVSSSVTNNGVGNVSFIEAFSADSLNVTDAWGSGAALSVGVRAYLISRGSQVGALAGKVNVGRMVGFLGNPIEVHTLGASYINQEGVNAAKNSFEIPQINEMSKEDLTLFESTGGSPDAATLVISETEKSYHSKSVYKVSATAPTNEAYSRIFGKLLPAGHFPDLHGKVVYLTLKLKAYGSAIAAPVAYNNTLGTEPRYPFGFVTPPNEVYTTPPVFFRYDSSLPLRVGFMLKDVMDIGTDYVEIMDMVLAPVGVDVSKI